MRLYKIGVLCAVLSAGYGCVANTGESNKGAAVDPVTQLEDDMGGAGELFEFMSSAPEDEVRALLESYGMHFVVHEDAIEVEELDKNITDCPQYFPTSDRNSWHSLSGEYYYIDGSGRPERAYKYMPPIASESRQSTCQANVGRWGDAENPSDDYDGGHMIGSQLGGWGGRANLVPQDLNFNRGNWVRVENKMADCGSLPSNRLFYYVRVSYSSSSTLIPSTFTLYLEDRVQGDSSSSTFQNIQGGGSSGTSAANRAIDFLDDQGCN